jgi:hypothetical protein
MPLTPFPRPAAAVSQPPALIAGTGGALDDVGLAWHSSIGQIIFFQSVEDDRL